LHPILEDTSDSMAGGAIGGGSTGAANLTSVPSSTASNKQQAPMQINISSLITGIGKGLNP